MWGHNATLLLNFPVNRDGLIHPTDSANAVDFYKNVQKQLANNLLKGVLPVVSNERGGKYTAKAVTDGEYDTYWATEDSVTSAVIEFEWPAPQRGKPYAVAGDTFRWDSVYSPLWWNIIRKGSGCL